MIIGIDPGFKGAIAVLNKDIDLILYDMPLIKYMNKNQVDATEFSNIIEHYKKQTLMAIVEDVHSYPKQGVTSTFTFGYNAGILLGVLKAHNIRTLRVKPSSWKCALGLDRNKKNSIALAVRTFPKYKYYFARAKDDGRAEAALLADYASRTF